MAGTTTPQELVNYYASLLILQYLQKPKAYASIQAQVTPIIMPQTTVEQITFSDVAASGTFKLTYGAQTTAAINWNDSVSTIQSKLQALTGLGSVTVSGSIPSQSLIVTFTGVMGIALLLGVSSNSLENSASKAISLTFTETDVTLPLAVQNAFNVTGPNPAQGAQLDIIGKYAGVTRTAAGFTSQITLDDVDFLSLIQLAIITNSAGSSLATIQQLLYQFFPGEILVFDYQNMQMSYLVSTSVGSQNLIQLFITEGLLPKPMGVELAIVIYAPDITNFFGFRTYSLPAFNAKPFNSYSSYNLTWPWLSYANAI
jgi:hypothetical protein